jgi:hypothetical protein
VTKLLHHFRLAEAPGAGVTCSEDGLLVGQTPLLERVTNGDGQRWRPREIATLDRELSRVYGLPVTIASRAGGLIAIARALNSADLLRAQIVAVHLALPDPPGLAKLATRTKDETLHLAGLLHASGLLKAGWNPDLHPRWPAGSPDSAGGRFAPEGGAESASAGFVSEQSIDIPLEEPLPLWRPAPAPPQALPYPPDDIPHPLIGPIPRNPYPDRPRCVKEWEDAWKFCRELERKGELGRPHSWLGRNLDECIRGQVSADCGGNPVT